MENCEHASISIAFNVHTHNTDMSVQCVFFFYFVSVLSNVAKNKNRKFDSLKGKIEFSCTYIYVYTQTRNLVDVYYME